MTDRELLELAAKAAGFNFNPTIIDEWGRLYGCFNTDSEQTIYAWDPRGNDGDALRLMVQLRLVPHFRPYSKVGIVGYPEINEFDAKDECAALRCAIVRAAAVMGAKMLQHNS